jgi:hypothetical protein
LWQNFVIAPGATILTKSRNKLSLRQFVESATIITNGCLNLATMFLYSLIMKVKKENIKLNHAIYDVVPQSFNLAKEIWESESIIDDVDYYIPDYLINNIFNNNHNKARKE